MANYELPKSRFRLCIFLVTLLALISNNQILGHIFIETTFVEIINYVGEAIHVHCQSGDTNLQMQELEVDEHYMFKFKPNFIGSTSYWCEFIWGDKTQDFNVWRGEDYYNRMPCAVTGPCVYKVAPEGFYWATSALPNDDEAWTFWKQWDL